MAGRPGLKRWRGPAATLCAALGCLSAASPAVANSAAAAYFAGRAEHSAVPALLSESDRSWYKTLFAAIRQQDWTTVQAMFDARPDGPLHAVARTGYRGGGDAMAGARVEAGKPKAGGKQREAAVPAG